MVTCLDFCKVESQFPMIIPSRLFVWNRLVVILPCLYFQKYNSLKHNNFISSTFWRKFYIMICFKNCFRVLHRLLIWSLQGKSICTGKLSLLEVSLWPGWCLYKVTNLMHGSVFASWMMPNKSYEWISLCQLDMFFVHFMLKMFALELALL